MIDTRTKIYRDTLAETGGGTAGVDPKAMTVSGILCTPTVDNDGDRVEPAGMSLERHRGNPIVLMNHNKFGPPVASAADRNGNYSVRVESGRLVGTAYFDESIPVSAEVFKMYDRGLLRGWSVGFTPLAATVMPQPAPGRRRGHHITRAELLEYSCVTIPNNPETLASYLSKGLHPAADPILRPLLEPFAAKPGVWSHGWTPDAAADLSRPVAGILYKTFDPDAGLPTPLTMTATAKELMKMVTDATATGNPTPAPARHLFAVVGPTAAFATDDAAREWATKNGHTPLSVKSIDDPRFGGAGRSVILKSLDGVDLTDTGEVVDLGDGVKGLMLASAADTPEPVPETLGRCVQKWYDGDSTVPHGADCLRKMARTCADHFKTIENPEVAKFFTDVGKRCKSLAVAHYATHNVHKYMPEEWDDTPPEGTVSKTKAADGTPDPATVIASPAAEHPAPAAVPVTKGIEPAPVLPPETLAAMNASVASLKDTVKRLTGKDI